MKHIILALLFALCLTACASTAPPPPETVAGPLEPKAPADSSDVDVNRTSGIAEPAGMCGDTGAAQFPWPLPLPTDRVSMDARWFGVQPGDTTSVDTVANAVERALRSVGHAQVGFQSVGCDGFAAISYLERIDANGRPLSDGTRFLPPGAKEPWSLSGYLTRLFSAPQGKYRQIVIVGTDRLMDDFGAAPTTEEGLEMIDDSNAERPPVLREYLWRRGHHRLVALIYEFDKPAGRGAAVHVPPRGLGGTKHLQGAGLVKPPN